MEKKENIKKEQEKRPGIYQSSGHPEHFKNEGGEYIAPDPENADANNDTKENADFDKMKSKAGNNQK
jgi:hypothetical protein